MDARRRIVSSDLPQVRAPLCRYIRSKGMFTGPREDFDPNAMAFDATIWWCAMTEKQLGPDYCPCHAARCLAGRGCFEPSDAG